MATFTNFCCRASGSNLNSGTRTGDTTVPGTSAFKTYGSGSWVAATGVFTVASGDPASDGIAAGDFASVYPDAATVTPFVGRVTARDATTITVSLTAKMGTAPVDGTTNTTLKVGGAWKGPNAAENFPFATVQGTLTNAAGDPTRVNLLNDATYNITASIASTAPGTGTVTFQGFSAAYNDLGKATIDGGTGGASYILVNQTTANVLLVDLICQNNGATGSATGVILLIAERVVVNSVRGYGLQTNGGSLSECEVYGANQSNTANLGGFRSNSAGSLFLNCIAHDNTGSNTSGFVDTNGLAHFVNCIADSNGAHGFFERGSNGSFVSLVNCDSYNNGGSGLIFSNSTNAMTILAQNSNFVKNVGWGVTGGTGNYTGFLFNCAFGAGTQANGSGTTTLLGGIQEINSITYASGVTPWAAPTTGDFRIVLAAAKNAGRGAFTQTQASYTGTIGYPDIGSAAHAASGGGLPMGPQGVI